MNKQQKIPEGWKEMTLGEIGKVSMCKRIFKEETLSSGDIPFYKIGTFGSKADAFISEDLYTKYKDKYPYPNKGDILISASGTIGRTVVFDGEKAYFQDSNIVWISNPEDKILNRFLEHVYKKTKWISTDGGVISRLYNDNLRSIKLLLPPLSEQNRIVQILETWDKYLKLLYKKINIKKNVKKALLQNLMTGKIRLKGFEDKWNYKKLGDAFVVNPSNHNLPEEFIYIDLGSVDKGVLIKENVIKLKSAPSRAQRLLDKGDVLFQMVRPYQRNNYYFDKNGDYVASTGYAQIRANGSSKFVYYLLHSDKFVNSVITRCTGSNYPAINSSDLSKIRVELPTTKEQAEISNLLTIADKEIETLERQRKIVLNQKKYLLNNLITGQIRVPEFASHN